MFKLDEAALNAQFGRRLDVLPLGVVSRSADFPAIGFLALIRLLRLPLMQLLGHHQEDISVQVIFTDQILQQNNADVFAIILRYMLTDILASIAIKCFSTGCSLIVGPLSFEYNAGMVFAGDRYVDGVEVMVRTSIEWNQLG